MALYPDVPHQSHYLKNPCLEVGYFTNRASIGLSLDLVVTTVITVAYLLPANKDFRCSEMDKVIRYAVHGCGLELLGR